MSFHLVVGLGNPGREYQGTRHNVGFDLLSILNQRFGGAAPRSKFEAEICELAIGTERVVLLAPQTYMNASGRSVKKAIDFFQLSFDQILVISDDFSIPIGRIRIRGGGSAGGQKGLADIARHLGTTEYPRLRVGIGPLPSGRTASDFVLGRFSKIELELLQPSLDKGADAVTCWVEQGLQLAMTKFNGEGG